MKTVVPVAGSVFWPATARSRRSYIISFACGYNFVTDRWGGKQCAVSIFNSSIMVVTGDRRSLSFLLLSSSSSSSLSSLGGYKRRAHWILASVLSSSFFSSYYTHLPSFLRLHLALGLDPQVAPNSPARHPSYTEILRARYQGCS